MGNHGKPTFLKAFFFKTWEVVNDHNSDIERFRKRKSAEVYARDMNNARLYAQGTCDGAVHTVQRRSF